MLSPRALDRAVERRWPRLFAYRHWYSPLYLAVAMLIGSVALVVAGPPYSFSAAAPIGGSIGLILRVLLDARRREAATSA